MVLRKRTREDEEEETPSLLSPSATPPSIANKRQRRIPPPLDAKARGSLGNNSDDNGLELDLGKPAVGALSNVRVTLTQPTLNAAEGQAEGEDDEEYDYDPEDVVPFGSGSDGEGDADVDDGIKTTIPKPHMKPQTPTPQLSAMNALLHELHTSHQRHPPRTTTPCPSLVKQPIASSSRTYRPSVPGPPSSPITESHSPKRLLSPAPSPFTCAPRRLDTNREQGPNQSVNEEGEKAIVTARYEETNRLLGSLFLSRRRQVNLTEELEEL